MATAYRPERDIEFVVSESDVRNARCQDPLACTLALSGRHAIGNEISVVYDELNGTVIARWDDDGSPMRYHTGEIEPVKSAIWLLFMTDVNKHKLVKQVKARGGVPLVVTKHRSRVKKPRYRSPEARIQEAERKKELAELRAAGLAPPPTPRRKYATPGRGMRGIGMTPVA